MTSSRRSCRARDLLAASVISAASLLAASFLAAAPPPGPLLRTDAPPCVIVHEPELSAEATRLAAASPAIIDRLTRQIGAPPMADCRLFLITRFDLGDEDLAEAGTVMPDWAAGIALPDMGAMVIRADRVGAWRQRELTGVFAHEMAHLLMFSAAGVGADRMPSWFKEGVAANFARDGEWLDFFNLWVSPIPSADHPLTEVGHAFSSQYPVMLKGAYAGSYSFVRFAMDRHSAALPARVMACLREGLDFDRAWLEAAGVSLADTENSWSSEIRGKTRWAAILTSTATLWLAITMLVLLAWLLKKRRAARMIERWEQEDPFS